MDPVLTSTEAASLCGVSYRTVIRWIQRGELKAFKLPGRGDHRVPLSELRRFMRKHAIPERGPMADAERRVLIAEDEPSMARAMQRVLKGAGFETAIAGDGFVAGLLLHAFKPRVLTLDIHMPGIDGFGVLRLLKSDPLPFPLRILVVSADTDERLAAAISCGAAAALRKPFDNQSLLEWVRRLMEDDSPEPHGIIDSHRPGRKKLFADRNQDAARDTAMHARDDSWAG